MQWGASFLFPIFVAIPALAAPALRLVPLVTSGVAAPTALETAPGEPGRLYVVLQEGRIVVLELAAGKAALAAKPFLDIRDKVTSGGEMGLLGLAFHPKFAVNRKYYLNYTTRRPERTTVIGERVVGSDREREVLAFAQPYENHNGGQLAFGPDGLLYIATGDGGAGGDPHGNGQSKKSLLGKILRLDVDRGTPYRVPADNPFAKGGGRGEIFAWGLRNPWRFSFDAKTGLLFAADVGQNEWEEIDVVEKGGNYGWNVREGRHCYRPAEHCRTEGLIEPIHEYGHDQGISVTGGYVYRGKKIPALEGVYVYGDFGSGKIWGLTYDEKGKRVTKHELLLSSGQPIPTFGVDAEGEILVASYHGKIFRLSP